MHNGREAALGRRTEAGHCAWMHKKKQTHSARSPVRKRLYWDGLIDFPGFARESWRCAFCARFWFFAAEGRRGGAAMAWRLLFWWLGGARFLSLAKKNWAF
jgi:hypothetical protein